MNYKFSMAAILPAFLIFAAGCQPANPESPDGEEASSGENSGSGGENSIEVWHIETGAGEEVLQDAAERFEEQEGVAVNLKQYQNDPYKQQISTSMGGNAAPDVFHSWGGGWLENFVDADQVVNITDDVESDRFLEAGLGTVTFDEEIYGVPMGLDLVPVWYNKEIFDEYGLEEPETYDELLDIVDTLNENDVIPFALANQTQWPGAFYLMYLAEREGGEDLFADAFSREGSFDDEAYIEAGEKIQELVDENAFPDGINGSDYDTGQSRQLMYSGDAAMEIMTSGAMLKNVDDEMPEFKENLDYFMFPEIEGGEGAQNHLVGGVSPAFSVSEQSDNKEAAIDFLNFISEQETATNFANESGAVSPVEGAEYEDEYIKRLSETLNEADFVQTYYDQTLPPALAEVHLDTTQALFGGSITPEEAAEEMEQAAEEELE
ncbi:extracellular solute-binding protein [Marinococcus halotolerans]|uniref:extracellular solute-binding protein n=1 Tax=Marinococcus halotolerans TaxID=301092 RepID=UPI000419213D|nr:extracellular solute-binding protein [Marinococcus halotolerans]